MCRVRYGLRSNVGQFALRIYLCRRAKDVIARNIALSIEDKSSMAHVAYI